MFEKFKIAPDRIIVIVIGMLLLTIGIVVSFAVYNFKQVKVSAKMVEHTQQVIIQAEKIASLAKDNVAASRGYVLSGKKEYLALLNNSKTELNKAFSNLKFLTTDNPVQRAKLDSLLFYITKRVNYSDSIKEIFTGEGKAAALDKLSNVQGKFLADNIYTIINKVQAVENDLLVRRKEQNEKAAASLNVILFSIVISMLVLLAAFIQKIRIDFKERKRASDTLVTMNASLEQRVAERTSELSASKLALEQTFLRITDAFIALDKNWCYTYINQRAAALIQHKAEELIGKNVWEIFPDAVGSATYHAFLKAYHEQQFIIHEDYYSPLDLWQENHIYPSPEGISVYINDVSEKKKAEAKIIKANRLYFFISQVNQMIVRTTEKQLLFDEACRIAVELGKFRMAWIGLLDEKTRQLMPVKHYGEEQGYLAAVEKIIAGAGQPAIGPVSKVISENTYVVCNDIAGEPMMESLKEAALSRGYLSSMILPITMFNRVTGVFCFYASEKDFFDSAEIALLEEATGDVSFALENFEKEELRKAATNEIKKSNDRFELIARATNDVIWDWNLLTNELWWNNNFYNLFGYSKQKLFTSIESWINGIHPEDRKRVVEGMHKVIDSGKDFWHDEYRHLKADDSVLFVYDRGFVLHDEAGKPYRMIGSMLDITELKNAEDNILKEKNLSDSIINSLPGIFYLYNKQGKFLRWNKNFETVSKYSAYEISNMHPIDFFAEDEKQLLVEKIGNVFITGEDNVQANFLQKTKDKVPYYFTGKAIEYEGEICLMGVGIDFTERIRAQEEIESSAEKLQELTAHLQEIRELERKRIGREIHDELGQQLTAIKMDVTWVDKKMPDELVTLKEKLKNIIHLLNGSNQSIRRILSELRPTILDDYGLIEALEWLSKQFKDTTGVPVKFTATETAYKVPEQVTTCIFRIYQEALTNITRYADAAHVITDLKVTAKVILFTIQDDGKGFDMTMAPGKKSFGILGMKERVLSMKGEFNITTAPGKGTTISINIPVNISIN